MGRSAGRGRGRRRGGRWRGPRGRLRLPARGRGARQRGEPDGRRRRPPWWIGSQGWDRARAVRSGSMRITRPSTPRSRGADLAVNATTVGMVDPGVDDPGRATAADGDGLRPRLRARPRRRCCGPPAPAACGPRTGRRCSSRRRRRVRALDRRRRHGRRHARGRRPAPGRPRGACLSDALRVADPRPCTARGRGPRRPVPARSGSGDRGRSTIRDDRGRRATAPRPRPGVGRRPAAGRVACRSTRSSRSARRSSRARSTRSGANYRAPDEPPGDAPGPAARATARRRRRSAARAATIAWDRTLTADVDAECELGVVIGTLARHVDVADAMDHVFGYTIVNDVSSRDPWLDGDQWLLGKSMAGLLPGRPVDRDAPTSSTPDDLRLGCTINGAAIQDGTTADMRFAHRRDRRRT